MHVLAMQLHTAPSYAFVGVRKTAKCPPVRAQVKYFDTVPPCASIAVLKTGFLFAASEYGNHALYQFIVGA